MSVDLVRLLREIEWESWERMELAERKQRERSAADRRVFYLSVLAATLVIAAIQANLAWCGHWYLCEAALVGLMP